MNDAVQRCQPVCATPGPWKISDVRSVEGEYLIVGGEGQDFGLIASVTEKADAELIVTLHAQVEVLTKALRDLHQDRRIALGSTYRKRIGELLSADTPRWPNNCHNPDSCARHFACMYIQCPRTGKDGNEVAEEIRASMLSLEDRK